MSVDPRVKLVELPRKWREEEEEEAIRNDEGLHV